MDSEQIKSNAEDEADVQFVNWQCEWRMARAQEIADGDILPSEEYGVSIPDDLSEQTMEIFVRFYDARFRALAQELVK